MTTGTAEIPAQAIAVQGEEMLQADEVAAMVRLHELGWGAKRLSKDYLAGAHLRSCPIVAHLGASNMAYFATGCGVFERS
jgi:hypothetical protein